MLLRKFWLWVVALVVVVVQISLFAFHRIRSTIGPSKKLAAAKRPAFLHIHVVANQTSTLSSLPFSLTAADEYHKLMREIYRSPVYDIKQIHNGSNCFHVQSGGIQQTVCLPTYLIAGVSKSGTSSLSQYLSFDKRFLARNHKETWHTHVPFAQELHSKKNELRFAMQKYLKYFAQADTFDCMTAATTGCIVSKQPFAENLPSYWDLLATELQRLNGTVPAAISLIRAEEQKPNRGTGPDKSVFHTGDATPDFHFYADIPRGMQHFFPHVKILLLVRNSLERAISTFRYVGLGIGGYDWPVDMKMLYLGDLRVFVHQLRIHKAELDLCQQWNKHHNNDNNTRLPDTSTHWSVHGQNKSQQHAADHPVHKAYVSLRKRMETAGVNPCHFQPFVNNHNNVFSRSKTSSHVKWWLQFYEPQNMLVIDYESFIDRPAAVMEQLFHFLGLGDMQFITGAAGARDALYSMRLQGPVPKSNPIYTKLESQYMASNNTFYETHIAPYLDKLSIGISRLVHRPALKLPHGAAATSILAHKELAFFRPSTVSTAALDEISMLFQDFDHNRELDIIESFGVRTIRPEVLALREATKT